jgi:thiol reductant ABC exporter CydC subunit
MSAIRWVLGLGRSGRGRLAIAIALGALASAAAVGLAATSAWLISRASQQPPVLHLMVAIVAVRMFGLARGVLRYGERLTGHDASFRILGDLRVATVERLEQVLPIRTRTGEEEFTSSALLSRFVDDTDGLQDVWVRVLLPYASAALVGAGTVALVVVLAPAAGIVLALSLVAAAVVAPLVSIRAARGAAARLAPMRADHQAEVLDLLDGATELAVYGALPARLAELDRSDRAMTRTEARSATASGAGAAVATLASGAAMWCGLWFGADAVSSRSLAAVSLAVVVLVPLAVHEVFGALAPAAHQLPALAGAASRLRAIFDQPPSVVEPAAPAAPPSGPFGLRGRGLHAQWVDGGAAVLRGADFDITPGTTTLVVGPSGAGKSTLAALLLRLVEPTAGHVELVGSDTTVAIDRMSGDEVRRIIGWCAQDAYVFDSTIEANLRLARPDATVDQIGIALRRARLDDWVATLPHGLDTMVGEHGDRLSGGQRQRLALARTLLADRQVVVFDEPTEHLDETTATELAHDIVDVTHGSTVIIVTHRPELFPGVDQVLLLTDGVLSVVAPILPA